jgi:hypothetical protein
LPTLAPAQKLYTAVPVRDGGYATTVKLYVGLEQFS